MALFYKFLIINIVDSIAQDVRLIIHTGKKMDGQRYILNLNKKSILTRMLLKINVSEQFHIIEYFHNLPDGIR